MALSLGLEKDMTGYNGSAGDLRPGGYRPYTGSLLLSTLAINILSLALPVMTLQVYDRILPNPGTGTLPILIAGVCLAIILEAVLRLCRAYVIGRSGAAYEHGMACLTLGKILNADLARMGSYGIGEHLHRMTSIGKIKDFYNGYSLTVYCEMAFVPLFLGLIIYCGGILAFVPAGILAIFAALSLVRGHALRRAMHAREKADDKRFNFLIESLEGVHTIKAQALEKFFERRYETLEEQSTHENYKVTQSTAETFNIGAIFSHLMVAGVISAGAWFVLNGQLTTGGLIATLLLSGRMMQPVQKALALWTRYQDYVLARRILVDLLETPQKTVQERDNERVAVPGGRLQIKNAVFSYQGSEQPLLQDVTLDIKRGESVLISGAHGCGKTTLLDMIAGIYTPTSGCVRIDGHDINSYESEDLVRHVGYIRSEAAVFRGTIRDNITCFGQADEAGARQVASLLHVDSDVAKLPAGFDTFLSGTSVDTIPPGLKQRIAMVRVLATKPKLILFDNADRTLDKEGYVTVYSLLAGLKGKASMIFVSDDHNIRDLADRHYVLANGVLTKENDMNGQTNIHPYRELVL